MFSSHKFWTECEFQKQTVHNWLSANNLQNQEFSLTELRVLPYRTVTSPRWQTLYTVTPSDHRQGFELFSDSVSTKVVILLSPFFTSIY